MSGARYTPGWSARAVAFMERGTAATHAPEALALLRPGMDLLDLGCGPGGARRPRPRGRRRRAAGPGRVVRRRGGARGARARRRPGRGAPGGAAGAAARRPRRGDEPRLGGFLIAPRDAGAAAAIAAYLAERLGDAPEAAALRAWGRRPGGMFAQAWVTAVGVAPA